MIYLWLIVKFFLLVLDCAGNVITGGSFKNTLSGDAWRHREHKNFGWCHTAIDWVFGDGHCEAAAEQEDTYGSVWAAWWAEVRGA